MEKRKLLFLVLFAFLVACTPHANEVVRNNLAGDSATAVITPTSTSIPATLTPASLTAATAADIAGIWLVKFPDYDPAYLIFRTDGTYSFSPNQQGTHGQTGKFWFSGTTLEMQNDLCPQDNQYTVVRQDKDGKPHELLFTAVLDPCPTMTSFLTVPPPVWVGALP